MPALNRTVHSDKMASTSVRSEAVWAQETQGHGLPCKPKPGSVPIKRFGAPVEDGGIDEGDYERCLSYRLNSVTVMDTTTRFQEEYRTRTATPPRSDSTIDSSFPEERLDSVTLEERIDSGFSESLPSGELIPPAFKQDDEGDNALMLSVLKADRGAFEAVLSTATHSRQINMKNEFFQTALHMAALTGQAWFARQLVVAGADVLQQDCNGNTALAVAAAHGDVETMRVLAQPVAYEELTRTPYRVHRQTLPQNCNVRNYEGLSPLHMTVVSNKLGALRHLLSLPGIDVNFREGKAGYTALHLAVEHGHEHIVATLLSRGADPWAYSHTGYTPLDLAILRGHQGILLRLNAVAALLGDASQPHALTTAHSLAFSSAPPALPFGTATPLISDVAARDSARLHSAPPAAFRMGPSDGAICADEEMVCSSSPSR